MTTEQREDAISRQAVLDVLDSHKYSKEFCEEHHIDWSINLGAARIVINDLPFIVVNEKTGKWIGDKCSNCGNERAWYGNNPLFCPDCGAKMKASE